MLPSTIYQSTKQQATKLVTSLGITVSPGPLFHTFFVSELPKQSDKTLTLASSEAVFKGKLDRITPAKAKDIALLLEEGGVEGWTMSQGVTEAAYLPDAKVMKDAMDAKKMKTVNYVSTTEDRTGHKVILFYGPTHKFFDQYFYRTVTRHQR